MKLQNFKTGDKVRIINYGQKAFASKQGYQEDSKISKQYQLQDEARRWFDKEPDIEVLNNIQGKEKPDNIISESDLFWFYDTSPELVGKEAIVLGSYSDLIKSSGFSKASFKQEYKLKLIDTGNEISWFNEKQLQII